MSHYHAIVLVKPTDDIVAEVARIMAAFSENAPEYDALDHDDESTEATQARRQYWWDWYRIGGRWDGRVRGLDYESAPGCVCNGDGSMSPNGDECHYSSGRHETLERNVIPVMEMGECRPFTLVTPEGVFSHAMHYVYAPDGSNWPWDYVDNAGHDRFVGEQLLAHRDCLAVGIDYHD